MPVFLIFYTANFESAGVAIVINFRHGRTFESAGGANVLNFRHRRTLKVRIILDTGDL